MKGSTLFLAACAGILLTGCMPKMTIEEMKQMMPQRPAELDLLDAFVGNWEGTGEMHFAGMDETLTSSSKSEIRWEGDRWYLVEHADIHMDEFGDMSGMATWTYDAKSKVYRNVWVDNMGGFSVGTGKYDAKTRTWHIKSTNYSAFGKSTAKGTARFIDDNTMEWDYAEYAMGGLVKTMSMTGTAKKVR
jgi:hypothetical protein